MAPFPDRRLQPRWLPWVGMAVVGLVAWFVFRRVTEGALLQWDDDINIQNNFHIRGLGWDRVRWMFTNVAYMRRYVPLAWLRWGADYQFFGPGPRSFHAGNLWLHVADAMLVFALTRQLLGMLPETRAAGPAASVLASSLGALIWALHPLRVEAVAWASSGMYCQAAFFLLWSMLAYLAAVAASRPAARRLGLGGSVLAFAFSMATYPVALGYVGVLLIADWLLLARLSRAPDGNRGCRAVWMEKIPFLLITLAILGVTLSGRLQAAGIWAPPPTWQEFGPMARVMQASYIWAYYAWKQLLPVALSPVYLTLVSFRPGELVFVASLAAVLLLTGLLLWRRRQWPKTLALWLCHLALLLPMLGLTEHPHYANDRYSYVVAIPWSVALAVLLLRLRNNPAARNLAVAAVVAALFLCGTMSAAQVSTWRDSETLFRYVLTRIGSDPYRHDILTRLGRTLLAEGRLPQAEASFREAVQVQPADREARGRLGLVLFREGRLNEAEAILGPGARLDPREAEERSALVNALVQAGWVAEAVQFCKDAVRLDPGLADAQGDLGIVLAKSGRSQEALGHLTEAIRLDPESPTARFNLGMALRAMDRPEEARAQFGAALRLQPDFSPARQALSQLPAP